MIKNRTEHLPLSEMYHEAGLATCHSRVDYSVTARLIEM